MPKVRVPKSNAPEITFRRSDAEPKSYRVSDDGEVTVAQTDLDRFLRAIPGAEVVKGAGNPDSKKEG